jgi:hypothetical protein
MGFLANAVPGFAAKAKKKLRGSLNDCYVMPSG